LTLPLTVARINLVAITLGATPLAIILQILLDILAALIGLA